MWTRVCGFLLCVKRHCQKLSADFSAFSGRKLFNMFPILTRCANIYFTSLVTPPAVWSCFVGYSPHACVQLFTPAWPRSNVSMSMFRSTHQKLHSFRRASFSRTHQQAFDQGCVEFSQTCSQDSENRNATSAFSLSAISSCASRVRVQIADSSDTRNCEQCLFHNWEAFLAFWLPFHLRCFVISDLGE